MKANKTFLSDLKKKDFNNKNKKTDKQTNRHKTQKKNSFTIYYEHRTVYAKKNIAAFLMCLYERQVKKSVSHPFSLSSFPYDDKI